LALCFPEWILMTASSFPYAESKNEIDGWFYNKNLTYELQLNWADVINALKMQISI
jgi:hypothetical protein